MSHGRIVWPWRFEVARSVPLSLLHVISQKLVWRRKKNRIRYPCRGGVLQRNGKLRRPCCGAVERSWRVARERRGWCESRKVWTRRGASPRSIPLNPGIASQSKPSQSLQLAAPSLDLGLAQPTRCLSLVCACSRTSGEGVRGRRCVGDRRCRQPPRLFVKN